MSVRAFILGSLVYLVFWISVCAVIGNALRTERPATSTPRVINQH